MDYTGKIISKTSGQPTQASASGVWTLDEAAAAVKNNSWPIPGVPNPISKSLRFNSADSAYLNRTPSLQSNRRTWTWSGWVKRSALGTAGIFQGYFNSTNLTALAFNSTNTLFLQDYSGASFNLVWETTAVFRDVSAWYHIVFVYDTTQASSANAVKLYVNGVQQTLTLTAYGGSYTQNREGFVNSTTAQELGKYVAGNYFNGYMTEIYFIDGQALDATSFGQTNANTGVWEPKPYTGTYGTNGFYLNFKDSATTTALGYDYSGNGNNWTPNNFSVTAGAGNDSLVDVPTQWIGYNTSGDTGGIWRGNYATLNPLDNGAPSSGLTLANGNLQLTGISSNWRAVRSTVAMSSGKWYCEATVTALSGTLYARVGLATSSAPLDTYLGYTAASWVYINTGNKSTNLSNDAYGASWTTNDVIGIAFDADAGTLTFYKNGVSQGQAFSGLTSGPYFFAVSVFDPQVMYFNFGQRPFAYTPPAGFVSLCTTNLPTPTIGATSTTQAGKYFNTVLYTGNGSTQSITGVGFQPDWVWIKQRSSPSEDHRLTDAVRGVGKQLISNSTGVEVDVGSLGLTAFNSDGFSVGSGASYNGNTYTYAAWNWKANGAGSSNTAGTITSTVSANTTAGFSIVTYTGNGSTSATVGHGLGTTPSMVIVKKRSAAANWFVKHASVPGTQQLLLNDTLAATNAGSFTNGGVGNLASTTFGFLIGTSDVNNCNENTATFVAYCFAPVAGYSAFGSYTGNGATDGPFVYLGFRPAYLLIKSTTSVRNWSVWDATRSPYNIVSYRLSPNLDSNETTLSDPDLDFVSNGFKIRRVGGDFNLSSSDTYIYMAFASNPFKYSLGR